jgi:polygalacturonase
VNITNVPKTVLLIEEVDYVRISNLLVEKAYQGIVFEDCADVGIFDSRFVSLGDGEIKQGGGIEYRNVNLPESVMFIEDSSFRENVAVSGGGVYLDCYVNAL